MLGCTPETQVANEQTGGLVERRVGANAQALHTSTPEAEPSRLDHKQPGAIARPAVPESRFEAAAASETDAPRGHHIDGLGYVVATAKAHGVEVGVTDDGSLWELGSPATLIATGVQGEPVPFRRGWIVRRPGEEPGQTDLWWLDGGREQRLTETSGGNDLPVVVDERTIAFVSTRTSVASWWRLDLTDDGAPRAQQLTNRGLRAGVPTGWNRFVPTPANLSSIALEKGALVYRDERGQRLEVDIATGEVTR